MSYSGVRIEDVARLSGLSTRNLRAYQSLGLLSAPALAGRVGFYDTDHLARLAAIRRLQDQGFSLAGIKVLLDAHDRGATLDAVLGLPPPATALGDAGDTPTPRPLRLALVPGPLIPAFTATGPTAN